AVRGRQGRLPSPGSERIAQPLVHARSDGRARGVEQGEARVPVDEAEAASAEVVVIGRLRSSEFVIAEGRVVGQREGLELLLEALELLPGASLREIARGEYEG